MSKLIELNAEDWSEVVENSGEPVVVKFWHHKCPACNEMKPIYEEVSEEMGGRLKFAKINLLESAENRKHAIQMGVRSTPTFMILCKGIPIGSLVGVFSAEELKQQLKNIVDNKESCLMATPLE